MVDTARFLLANLNGFDPAKDMVKPEEMVVLDRWAVGCAKAAQEDILKAYEAYDFHEVVQRLMRFCSLRWVPSTSTSSKTVSTPPKRIAWRVVAARLRCITSLKRWCAGWHRSASFTADEVWGYLPGEREKYVFTGESFEACLVWQTVKQ
ncbi:class I tRNA ligase family protein [Escherichia coli]